MLMHGGIPLERQRLVVARHRRFPSAVICFSIKLPFTGAGKSCAENPGHLFPVRLVWPN